jgi:hypothetical protein
MGYTHQPTFATDEQRRNQTQTAAGVLANRTAGRPPYNCPSCDRPTLALTPDEIVTYRCFACETRVDERGGDR